MWSDAALLAFILAWRDGLLGRAKNNVTLVKRFRRMG